MAFEIALLEMVDAREFRNFASAAASLIACSGACATTATFGCDDIGQILSESDSGGMTARTGGAVL
jgi:hypothetical protein